MRGAVGRGWSVLASRPAAPVLGVAAGFGAGLLLGGGPGAEDAALRAIFQFMAVLRSAMALGAAVLAAWRLSWHPVGPAGWYAAACFLMASGVWPMGAGGPVGLAALLVNGGLLLAVGVAWRDRAGWRAAWARRRAGRAR